jgi:tetratricopeptide (TPR) repeat protein
MDDPLIPSEALAILARLYREKRSGILTLGTKDAPLRVLVQDGQVRGLGPVAAARRHPDDSASLRLERILAELGIRPATPKPAAATPLAGVRESVIEALAGGTPVVAFGDGAPAPPDVAEVAGATEPLILEAVRRLRGAEAVRSALGDLDQRLECVAALGEVRTLTLLEGYLLSRIDGTMSARQVLQLVPLEPEQAERSLLGLLLTGRVAYRPAPVASDVPPPSVPAAPAAEDAEAPEAALDPETAERRREVLDQFQSLPLKDHFEVLGLRPGCTDAEVKRAYSALVKRFHPDVHRDPRLADLHDALEAIFIRVREAWEALADARSRASYEARGGPAAASAPAASPVSADGSGAAADEDLVTSEETLLHAQLLLLQARYWDAIQLLEPAVSRMSPPRHRNRARILLARAYAKNPNWLRRAEEQLQEVVRTDPAHVEAHYQLGLLYKAQGLAARAQAMFRRVLDLRPDHRDAATEVGGAAATGGGFLRRLFRRGKAP